MDNEVDGVNAVALVFQVPVPLEFKIIVTFEFLQVPVNSASPKQQGALVEPLLKQCDLDGRLLGLFQSIEVELPPPLPPPEPPLPPPGFINGWVSQLVHNKPTVKNSIILYFSFV
jgi:hypothetical protein